MSFWSVFSYSTQQQWTISQLDCDVQQKVDFIWKPVMTSSVVGQRRSSKELPKAKLPPEKGHGHCLVDCCLSDPLQLSKSQRDYYIREVMLSKSMLFSLLFSCSVTSDSLWPHGLQHTRPPCLLPTPRVYSNSCPLSPWCHPTILSSVNSFSSRLQSFPALGSFPRSQFFASGGQSTGVWTSASVLPMNIQDWSPLWLAGLISLQS